MLIVNNSIWLYLYRHVADLVTSTDFQELLRDESNHVSSVIGGDTAREGLALGHVDLHYSFQLSGWPMDHSAAPSYWAGANFSLKSPLSLSSLPAVVEWC